MEKSTKERVGDPEKNRVTTNFQRTEAESHISRLSFLEILRAVERASRACNHHEGKIFINIV